MPKKQGTLEVNGEVAYCGQSVQLLARATLRENILFGLPLDVEMYERALMCTHCQEWVADVLPSGIHSFSFVSRRTAMLHAHVRSLEVLPMMPRVHVCMHVFTHIHLHEPIRQCFAHANTCARMASGSAVLSFLFMCTHAHTNPYTHTHTHAGAGDQTVLGGEEHRSTVHGAPDATVTLSQAQLVLVALARAVYKDAAVYLLDGVCMCGVCMCVYATERVSCVGGWIDP